MKRRNHLDLIEFRACRFGVGEAAVAGGAAAAGAAAAGTAAAAGGTAAAAGGTAAAAAAASSAALASSLAAGTTTLTGLSTGLTGTALSSGLIGSGLSLGATAGSGITAAGSLGLGSAVAAGGAGTAAAGGGSMFTLANLLTAGKVALAAGSAAGNVASAKQSADNQKEQQKIAAKADRRKTTAEVQDSQSRVRAVLAQNDVVAAASGVSPGSGSQVALQGSALRGQGADVATINANSALRQQSYQLGRRRGALRGYSRAAGSLFDAAVTATDFF